MCSAYLGVLNFEETLALRMKKKILTFDNLVFMWKKTKACGFLSAAEVCENYLIQNFSAYIEHEGFFHCPRELLKIALYKGEVECGTEELFAALRNWGRIQIAKRQGNLQITPEQIEMFIFDLLPPATLFNQATKQFVLSW